MKRILQSLLFCACAVWAQSAQVVVPGGLAEVEGNSSSTDLFTTSPARLQLVYSSTEFAFAPSSRIDGISFRLDGESGQTFVGTWPSLLIALSTTSRSVDNLSPVFDDNAGADATIVFAGPLGILALNSTGEPRPFQVRITFATPFLYDPTRGNLSIGIISAAGSTSLVLDAQLVDGDSVSRVFGDGNASSGAIDTLGLVTRFEITPIPEPSIFALFAVSLPCLVSWWVSIHKRCSQRT